jgi:uncharacterized cysteine cluster protein YcgN (CxxCxxCC family)
VVFHRIAPFMAWKQATAVTLACELIEPESGYCVGVAAHERTPAPPAAVDQVELRQVEWLPDASVDPAVTAPWHGFRHARSSDGYPYTKQH